MSSLDGALLDLRRMDRLAAGETALHRLDPRAKVLTTLVFTATVVSFDRYTVSALLPFFLFPAVMISLGALPPRYIITKIAVLAPLAMVSGLFNPLFDREVIFHLGAIGITGGWISFASIVVRVVLTVGAATILVAVTGFPAICQALERLGAPRMFATQLLFLYRYIFVLAEEGGRVSRGRSLRSFGKRGEGMSSYGSLIGNLLLRTWRRAERIHMAMLARGFTGEFHTLRESRFGGRDLLFLGGWSLFFIVLRLWNLPQLLGTLVTGMVQ